MKKRIPKLRFLEFECEWEEKQVKEIANVQTGKKDTQNKVDNGVYPFFVRSDNVERINTYSFDGEAILTSGDGVGVGKNYHYINGRFDFHQRVYCINHFLNIANGKYFYYYFSSKFNKRVMKMSAKNSVDSVRMDMITDMEISLPTPQEQTKIANFLSAVDKKLEQLRKLKELHETYKKGVMQKIFSQEIRFKDENGNEFPEWEEKKLGEVGHTYNGLTGKSGIDFGSGRPFITYKTIFDSSKIDLKRCELVSIIDGEKQSIVSYGDIFFTTSSETPKEVGMVSVLLDYPLTETYLNSFCFGFRLNSIELISPFFMRFYLHSKEIRNEIMKFAQGSTRYNISKTSLMDLLLWLPSLPEQKKIADFLTAIDKKIEILTKKIERTEKWKKGLLQQMFI